MTRRRTDPELDRQSWRLSRAATTLPTVLEHIAEQLAHTTNSSSGDGNRPVNHISDPTGQAALQRHHTTLRRDSILEARRRVGIAIDLLDEACRNALGATPHPAADEPRCNGGDPSTWGDPECGELVEHYTRNDGTTAYRSSSLCVKHRKRRERWEREQVQEVG